MSIKTNECVVVRVSEATVTVAVNGENKSMSWDALRAACGQADAGLAKVYQGIRREAEEIGSRGPIVVDVDRDHTNVWWVVTCTYLHGGHRAYEAYSRTEGGTHPNHLLAASEAEDICQRLGSRVARREGFDGPAAKKRIRQISNG